MAATPIASSSTNSFVLNVPSNLESRRSRAAAVRRNHNLLADAPLGCRQGQKSRRRRSGRTGPHGVKFAHALGAHVVVFTTSPNKKDDALRLGADEVVVSRNADEMKKHAGSFDFILDAVAADHDINAYINLLVATAISRWWARRRSLLPSRRSA